MKVPAGSTFGRVVRQLPPLETAALIVALAILVAVALAGERAKQAAQPALDSYSTYDAATGGYGALYELLAREGVRVERFEQRPAFLDRALDTLVWAEPLAFDGRQIVPSAADVRALEDYVRAGGRLLYVGHDDAAAKANSLALPGTRPASDRRRAVDIAAPLARAGVRDASVTAARRYVVTRRDEHVLFDDGRGAVAVSYPFGRGRVTAVIDEAMFANARLAADDHARLIVALATPGRPGGRVAFDETVHGYAVVERWWQIFPRPFAIALSIAGAALLLAFAGAAMRLGPPLVPVERDDRTTADFVAGLASLFERARAAGYALDAATRSTARTIARGLGFAADASFSEIAAALDDPAERAAFGALVAARNGMPTQGEFVRLMALADRLRKEYATRGRPRY